MEYKIADPSLAPAGHQKLDWAWRSMPVLNALKKRYESAQPLAGVIVLADEATGNLDTRTSYEIMSLFQHLHEQGKTIAFVTHESDIAVFTSRTIFLRDGHILRDEPVQTKSAAEALAALPIENDY